SVDNGATWSVPARVTTATTNETTGTADLGNQYGDYNGLSVAKGAFFPCWTDRRDNRSEAIFTARISVSRGAAGVPVVAGTGGEEAPAKKKAAVGAGTPKK